MAIPPPPPLARVTIGALAVAPLLTATVWLAGTAEAPLAVVTTDAVVPALVCWVAAGTPGLDPSAAPPRAPSPSTVAVAAALALRLVMVAPFLSGDRSCAPAG